MPDCVILYPSHVIFIFANSHFSSLIAKFSSSKRLSISLMSDTWSAMVPFVIIRISSRKLNLFDMFSRVLSIVVRKVAGMSDRP